VIPGDEVPRTPAGFTGTRRSEDPDGSGRHALLRYVDGEVVEVVVHEADGRVVHRAYAEEAGAFRTVHLQSRFVWRAGDVEVEP
jgi:hypothetical protein